MAPKAAARQLALPNSVVGPVDLGRLLRELETIENALMQLRLQTKDKLKLPATSRLLDQTIELNKLDLLEPADLQKLQQFLHHTKETAPVLHISFGADPSVIFTQKLVLWLRQEIDPSVLLTIGLQPSIGAGCMVRTTNKHFDFSLRERFTKQRQLLIEQLQVVTQ
jgi:F0F1-type ATP synthase delta subunit